MSPENRALEAACIAYNSVLLNQPEDCRDQTVAMQAALTAARAERDAEVARLREALREMLEIAELYVPAPLDAPGFKRARAALTPEADHDR